jgi:hypothetical protein
MGARTRLVEASLLLLGVGIGLAACMGGWFTPQQIATLIIGDPVAIGGKWEVVLSVANIPDGGLASIAVDNLGFTYTNVDGNSVVATGLNGFVVLAQEFITTPGKGRLTAANAAAGVEAGTIVKITFTATGANPTLTIQQADKGKVTLGSGNNRPITTWTLGTGRKYYAK